MAALCGAKTRSGAPCKGKAMSNGRCRMHGGKSLSGIASPRYKHGRYSVHLPARMAADYEASLDDPDLLSLRTQIAVTEARWRDLLKRVDTGEAGQIWSELQEALKVFLSAQVVGDPLGQEVALSEMKSLISRGQSDSAIWAEIGQVMELRRKLGESETKRLIAMQQMMTTGQVMLFLGQIEQAVKRHVDDPHILGAIAEDIGKLVA